MSVVRFHLAPLIHHIVKRVFWYVAIPIFQAKSTRRYEKIIDHNIGVKPLSVAGSNPAGPIRQKRDEIYNEILYEVSTLLI